MDKFLVGAVYSMMTRFGGITDVVVYSQASSLISEGEVTDWYSYFFTLGEYDPSTSEFIPVAPPVYSCKTIVLDYALQGNGDSTMYNTLIRTGDKRVYLQPVVNMPRLNPASDIVMLNGVRHKIITYKEVNPSQTGNYLVEMFVRE